MQPHMKHIAIKYHHIHSFSGNCDVEIQHIDTKEQIADIFTKPLDSELFRYLCYKLNSWYINGVLIHEEVWYYTHKAGILVDLS